MLKLEDLTIAEKQTKNNITESDEDNKTEIADSTNGMFGLDKTKYPSNMGKAWSEEEVIKLLKAIQKKRSIREIAKTHQRTEGGILSKLKSLAAEYYIYDKRDIEQIEKFTGLSREIILEAVQKKQYRDSLKKEKTVSSPPPQEAQESEPSLKEIYEVMKDIQQKMKIILENIQ